MTVEAVERLAGIRRGLQRRLLDRVQSLGLDRVEGPERRLRVRHEALTILREEGHILPRAVFARLVNEVSDHVVGLGPIESLLKDPDVSEVMVNGADDVYVERRGRIERVDGGLFEGEEAVFHLIERIVAPLGLRVDEASPYVDARLPDGSRVHAIVPPLSLRGPVVTIRKFRLTPFRPADLLAVGTLGPRMLRFLEASVRGKANIVICGGASSGKTTLLNVLSGFIPDHERVITIEDAAELRLSNSHVIGLEARPANVEGRGEVTVRDLVRTALRMRPDRILVGEVRGGEALDMLQAMNTGHEGSVSTAHANSPHHLLWRLETMALMSDVELPVEHVRGQISAAIDVIVHMGRLREGRRVVLEIATVDRVGSDGMPSINALFTFSRRGVDGAVAQFSATGRVPHLIRVLAARGVALPDDLFAPAPDPPPWGAEADMRAPRGSQPEPSGVR
jgi:pilus assembly protein CpaF